MRSCKYGWIGAFRLVRNPGSRFWFDVESSALKPYDEYFPNQKYKPMNQRRNHLQERKDETG